MKKYFKITTIMLIVLFSLSLSFTASANECRDVKLSCKEDAKIDGDYSAIERNNCRQLKLECKAEYL